MGMDEDRRARLRRAYEKAPKPVSGYGGLVSFLMDSGMPWKSAYKAVAEASNDGGLFYLDPWFKLQIREESGDG